MKRIPLAQLKKILRAGDYVGSNHYELHLVKSVTDQGFRFGALGHNCSWDGKKVLANGVVVDTWKTYYWLPGSALYGQHISEIKKERLRQSKLPPPF